MTRNRWEYRTRFFNINMDLNLVFSIEQEVQLVFFFHEDRFESGSLFLKQVVRLLMNININLKLVLKINIALNLNIDLEKL